MPDHLLKKICTALALAYALFLSLAAAAQAPHCREVSLAERPGWTISGAWSSDGSTLLVVDAFYNKILQYTRDGRALKPMPPPIRSDQFTPSVLRRQGADLVLELSNARMVRVGRDRDPRQLLAPEGQPGLKGIFQWELTGRDEVVVFGDVLRGNQEWVSGFYRVPLGRPGSFHRLGEEISPEDPMRLFYRLGSPLIASLPDGTTYILLMEERPRIVRYRKGSVRPEPLKAFPPELAQRPTLPAWKKLDEFAQVMQEVESSSMPVSLLAWERHLWVVSRHVERGRTTRWVLTKIDPVTDRVVWTTRVDLPKTVHHVTVVPGPREWAWIHKGVVRRLFSQDVEKVLFLPAERLRSNPGASVCP